MSSNRILKMEARSQLMLLSEQTDASQQNGVIGVGEQDSA
jgi:hypothetical protein